MAHSTNLTERVKEMLESENGAPRETTERREDDGE